MKASEYYWNKMFSGGGGAEPTGTIDITENGTYDVTEYASADVAVPQPAGETNITENGTYDVTDYVSAVVDVPQPSGSVTKTYTTNGTYSEDVTDYETAEIVVDVAASTGDDVLFYDYDGTILYQYSAEDFLGLNEMPANPDRTADGLVAQGWNWTLAGAQTYVQNHGMCDIGQMYTTVSGATEVDIILPEGRTEPYMGLGINGTVTIDWGDGTTPDTVTGTSLTTRVDTQHVYTQSGSYTIKITVVSGSFRIIGNSYMTCLLFSGTVGQTQPANAVYADAIKRVRVGDGCDGLHFYGFAGCKNLEQVSFPTTCSTLGSYGLYNAMSIGYATIPDKCSSLGGFDMEYCYNLSSISFPQDFRDLGNGYTFGSCYELKRISVPDAVNMSYYGVFTDCENLHRVAIPNATAKLVNSVFGNCYTLETVRIPDSATEIQGAFQACRGLEAVELPSGLKTLSGSFQNCANLTNIEIPSGLTTLGQQTFSGCTRLRSITVPSGVSTISSSAFSSCKSLQDVTLAEGITTIASSAFNACDGLVVLTVPSTVTSIQANAFYGCYGMKEYHIKAMTPPTLANSNAFTGIPSDCIIYVPAESLSAYQTATNWSTYAAQLQGE